MTHAELVLRAESWLVNTMNCRFALTEVTTGIGECPDAIGWKYAFQSHLVEVKVSRSDFFADQKKHWRVRPQQGVGMFRWMMVPEAMVTAEEMDRLPGWGLLWAKGRRVFVRRKAEEQAGYNRTDEIGLLVQTVANAQLCTGNLNRLFADPESPVGRTRQTRRMLGKKEYDERALYDRRAAENKAWLLRQAKGAHEWRMNRRLRTLRMSGRPRNVMG